MNWNAVSKTYERYIHIEHGLSSIRVCIRKSVIRVAVAMWTTHPQNAESSLGAFFATHFVPFTKRSGVLSVDWNAYIHAQGKTAYHGVAIEQLLFDWFALPWATCGTVNSSLMMVYDPVRFGAHLAEKCSADGIRFQYNS